MDKIFNSIPENDVEQVVTPRGTDERKAKVEAMKGAISDTIKTDPTFLTRLRKYSNSIKLVNSLGFGDNGNIVVDHSKSTKENRVLAPTSAIVGYRIANVGDEPIKYATEVWSQDEDGKFVPEKVERVLAPEGYADLTRQYMTIFCSQPEISFQLANGKVVKGSGASKGGKNLKSELESYYVRINKSEDGTQQQINDDSIKLNVGEKIGDKWVVKPEFVEIFGFLNNPKETTSRSSRSSGEKVNSHDLAANWVQQMIAQSGL